MLFVFYVFLVVANKRLDRTEGRGYRQAHSAFHSLPVLMGQNGAYRVKIIVYYLSIVINGSKTVIDLHPGLIDQMPSLVQKLFPVPQLPCFWLMHRKIENSLTNVFTIRV